ncbi:MAG: PIG-L family deacetylase [Flammeovirgaceae bacterium]
MAQGSFQPTPNLNAAEIKHAIQKLQVMGSVLYVAAHPDDENTRLITYLAKGRGYETTYLSLTRGDGGQNLIGKEIEEYLGLLRTQELLAARRIDGGKQLFSRANDFGYSKTPEETYQIWNKQEVLADVVWAIRKTKPDVIITRFSPTLAGTHGHHTASAQLALEAFKLAADEKAFPEQLEFVKTWQAKRIFWNTSTFFFYNRTDGLKMDTSKIVTVDVGGYNPLLGKSYAEIAAMSRSQHKCQGFGAALQRGTLIEYLWHLEGEQAQKDLMDNVETSWKRLGNEGELIQQLLKKIDQNFQLEQPAASIPLLLEVHQKLKSFPKDEFWVNKKRAELEAIILQCAGFWMDATTDTYSAVAGDSIQLTIRMIKQSDAHIHLEALDEVLDFEIIKDSLLPDNQMFVWQTKLKLSEDMPISNPYWLNTKGTEGMYVVEDQMMRGMPENTPSFEISAIIKIEKDKIPFYVSTPVFYRWVDPSDGERYRPFEITPPITANLNEQVYLFTDNHPKKVEVLLKAHQTGVNGKVRLEVPKGWKSEPSTIDFQFKDKYQEQKVLFMVYPSNSANEGMLKVIATVNNKEWSKSIKLIDYKHIPMQVLFPNAESKLVKVELKKAGQKIAYLVGAGDAVPESLRQIGYQVDIIEDEAVSVENLQKYDAVVLGIRAYNTNPRMRFHQEKLFQYVEKGGTVIVQYNTANAISELMVNQLAPYPLKISRERVTDEKAKMTFLAPNHPILNFPNKLTDKDFDGWVQERGLYFPSEWGAEFIPILECADANEKPSKGILLATEYGKGKFIYTGISFFRQLPAGVSGAYRLFANMLSWGKEKSK